MTANTLPETPVTGARGIDYQSQWTLARLIEPDIEPITAEEAKTHMNETLVSASNDTYIEGLITAAREWVEEYTGACLIDQTWQLKFRGYVYGEFRLRRYPIIEVQSFVYDEAGTATTLASTNYEVDGPLTKFPKLIQSYDGTISANYTRPITIQFRAGFANRSVSPTEGREKVPAPFKHAIKLLVGHLYENREADPKMTDVPMAVKWLLNTKRAELGVV
jgi:uncharacterized phiE125 gp8 family phage protein